MPDTLADRWAATQAQDAMRGAVRRVHYLSMEFLIGRALDNAFAALDVPCEQVVAQQAQSVSAEAMLESEADAALGNGGLGRLAACFLDSFATLGLPSFGYGMRYENGMFAQRIQDGCQVEVPDDWMQQGNPWELARHEISYPVGLGAWWKGMAAGGDGIRLCA